MQTQNGCKILIFKMYKLLICTSQLRQERGDQFGYLFHFEIEFI